MTYFNAGCGSVCFYFSTGEPEAGRSAWSTQGIPGRLHSENTVLTRKIKNEKIK